MVVFLVLQTIIKNERISQRELIKKTNLSERTIRNHLKFLLYERMILAREDISDLRYKFYELRCGK
ncbi:winged helix-turn-helix domain-containing protein [Candidatus Woesearchaeota archaeon]|nr:winged helix-turn-helix domain-containing protein [Candidatus Woesearchaeota archaeon]